jgi:CHAT domain-containing protein
MRYLTVNTPEQHMHRSFTPSGWLLASMCLLLAGLLLSCDRDEASAPPLSDYERGFRDSLDAVTADYAELRLWEALAGARRLRARVDAAPDSLRGELRAELYQYLTMLHFDRDLYRDSVTYYYDRSTVSIAEQDLPSQLRPRQLLCLAYVNYVDWAYHEMELNARYGSELLAEQPAPDTLLMGLLRTAEGRGRKQRAYRALTDEKRTEGLRESEDVLKTAVEGLTASGSPWSRYPADHLILVYIQQNKYDPQLPALIDTLTTTVTARNPVFGFKDRLLGYYHQKRGRSDSADLYYARLLERRPLYVYSFIGEALYMRKRIAEERTDWADARALNMENMRAGDCCPESVSTEPLRCNRRSNCLNHLYSFITYDIAEYMAAGEQFHLDRAYATATEALSRYQRLLRYAGNEEATLNKNMLLGERLISACLSAAYARVDQESTTEHMDFLFRCMEVGRTYVLTQELIRRGTKEDRLAAAGASAEQIEVETAIKLLKGGAERSANLSPSTLNEFQRLRSQREAFTERQGRLDRAIPAPTAEDTVPSVAELRQQLSPTEAFVEFADTDRYTYALYADRDTQIAYRLDADAFRQLSDRLVGQLNFTEPSRAAATFANASHLVYGAVLGPVASEVVKRRDLLVVPSTNMAALPFGCLVKDPPNGAAKYGELAYLVNSHSIRYLDSWRADARLRPRRNAPTADRFRRAAVWTHRELRGYLGRLGEEIIPQVARDVTHYPSSAVNAEEFWAQVADSDLLHLSVHAASRAGQLHQNHLYLAPGDSLNGLVIGQRPLSARLVVLAACSTARGQSYRREGTFSLRRSFHLAGVPDVVTALYDIPAAATAVLLEDFYRGLRAEGYLPARVLAEAQRGAIRGDLGERYRYPGYWAGLVVG